MNKIKNYFSLWLIPLLLISLLAGCDDRVGITSPPDITIPKVSSTSPVNQAVDEAYNIRVTATFSEAMDSLTITTATFTLMQGTVFVSGTVTYTGTTASFAPSSNLEPNTNYTATITSMAKNLAGNALADNYVWSFTTGAAAAITPPTVIITDPANAAVNIPINQKIAATFSTTMDASTITASTFTVKQGTNPVSGFVFYSGTTAIFAPSGNLSPNTLYTATITTGAKDLASNALVNNYVWSFTTGAAAVITPPTVILTDPVNNAVNVPLDKHVSATFSKTMDASTITTSTFTLMQGATFVSGTVSYVGTTATYIPSSNLVSNTTYTATITTGAKDLAGNSITTNYVWSFTTSNIMYTVNLSSNPASGGTTTGGGSFNSGTLVMLNATVNPGYTFNSWTENGNIISTDSSYQFNITGNRALVANFTANPNLYTITLLSIPAAGGVTSGGGAFSSGSSVSVTAVSNSGYSFVNWSENGNIVSTDSTYQFIISGNRTLIANFSPNQNQYSVTLLSNPITGGTTSGGGSFNSGSSVTVMASKNVGYMFSNWTENGNIVSTDSSYQFIISGNRTLTANFESTQNQYTVILLSNPLVGGTTSGGGTFNSGASVTVTAIPNVGYSFTNWTENGVSVSTSASYQFTISGNRTLTANFTAVQNQYVVLLISNPVIGGTTSGGGTFNSGATVTVTATPNVGYTFTDWTENGTSVSTNSSYQFNINGNRTLTANFTAVQNQYVVTLISNPVIGGTTSGGGTFNSGASVTVTATPNVGYTFTDWTENGVSVSTNATYQFNINGNRTLTANFAAVQSQYIVVLISNPILGGTTSGGGTFNSGSTVTVIATPNAGYTFTNWTENGASVSTNSSYQFIINGNRTLTANFAQSGLVIDIGSLSTFGSFGGSAGLTNQGIFTIINGNIGTTAASTLVTGFHDTGGNVFTETPLNIGTVNGVINCAPPAPGTQEKFTAAQQALADATKAYNYLAGLPGGPDPGAGELGGLVLAPGTYTAGAGTFKITSGDLTLDAQGNPNAVWVFQIAQSLTVGLAGQPRSITLVNGAQAKNVFWQVGSAATINGAGGGTMVGTIISMAGVTFSTAGNVVLTRLNGRAISLVASVTVVNTIINIP